MMVNNKYATSWTYYDGTKSMNVNLGFLAVFFSDYENRKGDPYGIAFLLNIRA
jgi:hypothetical protein